MMTTKNKEMMDLLVQLTNNRGSNSELVIIVNGERKQIDFISYVVDISESREEIAIVCKDSSSNNPILSN